MVKATIQAQELTEEVEAALRRAEASERELRAVAEFREMFIGDPGARPAQPHYGDPHVSRNCCFAAANSTTKTEGRRRALSAAANA